MPDYLWAFESGRSISQMAANHCNRDLIISLDLKDFFGSIRNTHLIPMLSYFNIYDRAAEVISELCTYKYYLPQGAVTSPKLSNMVTSVTFGPDVAKLCEDLGATLTIYADDITISMDNPARVYSRIVETAVGEDLVSVDAVDATTATPHDYRRAIVKYIVAKVTSMTSAYGFPVNHRKTKVMGKSVRQYVCGVVTNSHPNLIKRDRKWLRAVVHNITTNGVEAAARVNGVDPDTFVLKVRGKILWFKMLNEQLGGGLLTRLDAYLDTTPYRKTKMTSLAPAPTPAPTSTPILTVSESPLQ